MKASVVQIHWHAETASIYSAHFEPCHQGRLATAGGDGNIRVPQMYFVWHSMYLFLIRCLFVLQIWRLERSLTTDLHGHVSGPSPHLVYLSTLSKHTQAVNVVRFSPQGMGFCFEFASGVVFYSEAFMFFTCLYFSFDKFWVGGSLASGGDDGYVFIWTLSDGPPLSTLSVHENVTLDKETWRVLRCCRSAGAEIYDLAWSPDSAYLLTGSMDHIARIYNVKEGQCIHQLTEHTHYIQGVAWDPLNMYLATMGSDRTLQLYRVKTNERLEVIPYASFSRAELSGAVCSYHNETLLSFFRRLTFTPDGSLLLVPAGQYRKTSDSDETFHTVYIYTRVGLNQRAPVAHVSGYKRPAIAVCCSPKYYTLRSVSEVDDVAKKNSLVLSSHLQNGNAVLDFALDIMLDIVPNNMLNTSSGTTFDTFTDDNVSNDALNDNLDKVLPNASENTSSSAFSLVYRMVYAVATQDTVVLYDTQQRIPIGVLSNFHYATLTDLAWSFDGDSLLMTSTDGFCSVVMFDKNELGEEYTGPRPSLHIDHVTVLKDVLKTSVNRSDSTVNTPCLSKSQFSEESDPSLCTLEKKLNLASGNKEKKRRVLPVPIQSYERKQ
ncbi:hypothetical protein PORY_002316 [Pneumocystis oryctolagi]|uniref:Uncharacterized protein n=1 Tax=Pneumocystis oryctolagi TaxID=42067 RepID=A0ACB7C9T5_9ASCO|nr:hypothetical protein PORY_002316 [Pneumocystis oryctolagi]